MVESSASTDRARSAGGDTLRETVGAFAIAAPGLEPVVGAELEALGIGGTVEAGGVAWRGDMASVARANLWLRSASRVIVRVAEFRARTFWELERHATRLPWARFLAAGVRPEFRVTSRKSRLYHTEAIAERLHAAAARAGAAVGVAIGEPLGDAGTREDDDGYDDDRPPGQLFVVRIVRDLCTISADTSGQLLHRRGYRQAVAKAPLRETIAAAMVLASGWPGVGDAPLLDPMCGSGTIAIEAAMMARRIAPGLGRDFAFERWPGFEPDTWDRIRAEAVAGQRGRVPAAIRGSDRDAGAIDSARANAERAGVAADIEFDVRAVSAIEPPPGRGWVVTNPPYGIRVGDARLVKDLYAALGNVLRARCAGWRVALLSPDPGLERQVALELDERFATVNGGIPVRLVTGQVPG